MSPVASTRDLSERDEAVRHAIALEEEDDISYSLAQRDQSSAPLATAPIRPLPSLPLSQPPRSGRPGAQALLSQGPGPGPRPGEGVGVVYEDWEEDEFRLDSEGHSMADARMYACFY